MNNKFASLEPPAPFGHSAAKKSKNLSVICWVIPRPTFPLTPNMRRTLTDFRKRLGHQTLIDARVFLVERSLTIQDQYIVDAFPVRRFCIEQECESRPRYLRAVPY